MSKNIVTESRAVLLKSTETPKLVSFAATGSYPLRIWIPTDGWVDLGKPKIITITIEPGDTLNGEDHADEED